MAGAAAHRDARQQAAAARDPHGEPARLRHDRGVGLQQARGEQPAGAGRLLLGDRVDDQVAGQRDAELGERAGRRRPCSPRRPSCRTRRGRRAGRRGRPRRTGRLRPVGARLDVDDVDVAVEQQRATAAAAAEARDELRAARRTSAPRAPSGAAAARRRRARAASTSAPWARSSAARCSCSARSCARRRPRRVRDRVERHELARECHERLAARGDGVDDALLLGESCMRRYRSPRERQTRRRGPIAHLGHAAIAAKWPA